MSSVALMLSFIFYGNQKNFCMNTVYRFEFYFAFQRLKSDNSLFEAALFPFS